MESQILEIGYNNLVTRGKKAYQIQTEIIQRDIYLIKTTIMESALVVDTVTQIFEDEDDVTIAKSSVEFQHKMALSEVQSGRYD